MSTTPNGCCHPPADHSKHVAHTRAGHPGARALREAAEALRQAERDGYLFLDGSHERVPWEAVADWLDARADVASSPGATT
mgnify:CR=1 FL=1